MTTRPGAADCATIRERLVPLLDGELVGKEAARIRAHLEGCDGCSAAWTELRELRQELRRETAAAEIAPTAAERQALLSAAGPLLAELRETTPAEGRDRRPGRFGLLAWLRELAPVPRLGLAAAAAACVAVFALRWTADEREPRSATVLTYPDLARLETGESLPLVSASFERLH